MRISATLTLMLAAILAVPPASIAGGTPTPPPSELFQQIGSGNALAGGDYVATAAAPGLDTFYSFFVEVPPATANLNTQFFDADIGAGGAAAAFDLVVGVGFNTSVSYSVFDPTGALVAGPAVLGPGACAACNNAWVQFPTFVAPLAGHWEVRVDVSSAVTAGDDVNSFGIRAHDGNAGVGGTELNVYAESYAPLGSLGNPSTSTTNLYPYVSSGCEFDSNDFDGDAPQAGSALVFNSRTNAFSQAGGISGSTVWLNNTISGWTSDNNSLDYGIWHAPLTITSVAGGLTANIVTFWAGAFNAANPPTGGVGPPPASQPQADSFRLYLPRDGGGAPVKTYVEQQLTHVSGPNPPMAGVVSQVRVTLRVVNPTPNAITFATPARVVTANVPGGGAVYAGGVLLSQGVVTAQPALGGTGNVVWDPSVVAAGATVILGYLVDVTPPAPASRVVVTGTPSAQGTTATFLDETARLAQTRATYGFGPLCELAVTANLTTHATVSELRAFMAEETAVVEWLTTSEVATEAFEVYRHDPSTDMVEKIHPGRQLGLLVAPQGGRYRLTDPAVSAGETVTYTVVEIEKGGGEHLHGPYEVVVAASGPSLSAAQRVDSQLLATPRESDIPRSTRGAFSNQQKPRVEDHKRREQVAKIKLSVPDRGLYLLKSRQIAEVLNLGQPKVQDAIDNRSLNLRNRRKSIAWLPHPEGLIFFASPSESQFSAQGIYMLEFGTAREFGIRDQLFPAAGAGPTGFPSRRQFEQDLFAATAFGPDPESDYWFWKAVVSGHPQIGRQEFLLEAPGLTNDRPAQLEIRLQSATDSGVAGEHQARISIAGVELGTAVWSGINSHQQSFDIPPDLMLATGSTLEVEGLLADDVAFSGFFIDGFDLTYPRRLRAVEGRLEVNGVSGAVTVSGLGEELVYVLDVTEPEQPILVKNISTMITDQGQAVAFEAEQGARYWLASASALKPVGALTPVPRAGLASSKNRADYLVISHPSMLQAASKLASSRQRRGLVSKVVSVERIYDEFAAGYPEPAAISQFLQSALANWQLPPRYVVLAGAGSYDYRDLLGFGTNLVPPSMVSTAQGLFASDQPFADLDGDGVPELIVGRIPAYNDQDLAAYVQKIEAFESIDRESWEHRWIAVADRADGSADFAAETDSLTRLLPDGIELERIYLGQVSLETAQQALQSAWQQGAGVVHYVGHGGLDRLSGEGLLTSANALDLDQGPLLPSVVALTCAVNRFALPGFVALGETLVMDPNGGASTVFSATGLSQHAHAKQLAGHLQKAFLAPSSTTVGSAIDTAIKSYLAQGGDADLLRVYSLLGDPLARNALRPRSPRPSGMSGDS